MTQRSDFWNNQEKAREMMRAQRAVEGRIATARYLGEASEELEVLAELAGEDPAGEEEL